MSQFVEVKTNELIGAALDWAVAQVESEEYIAKYITKTSLNLAGQVVASEHTANYRPSTNWAQGGPLIDKYKHWVSPPVNDPDPEQPYGWGAEIYDEAGFDVIGRAVGCPSALISICRAIVTANLGDVVQVPAELVGWRDVV